MPTKSIELVFHKNGAQVGRRALKVSRILAFWKSEIARLAELYDLLVLDRMNPTQVDATTLIEVASRPASPESFPVFLYPRRDTQCLDLTVTTYSPELAKLALDRGSIDAQLAAMVKQLHDALALQSDIFVAPESFFHKVVDGVETPCSEAEKTRIEEVLLQAAGAAVGKLIIAGTILWTGSDRRVHNSLLLFYGTGRARVCPVPYDKKCWTGEEETAAAPFGTPALGESHYLEFTHRELECCVQICQDSATPAPKASTGYDVHVVCGNNTNLFTFKTKPGGIGIYADANGMCAIIDVISGSSEPRQRRDALTRRVVLLTRR